MSDHGTFEISAAGKNVGTETFDIHSKSGQIEAQSDVHLQVEQSGKPVDVQTSSDLLLTSRLEPVSYTWSQKGTHSSELSVDFRSSTVHLRYKTLDGKEDRRDIKLSKDLVVIDDNALHQYQLALARYDWVKGGLQSFNAFIPQEALPGIITLSFVSPEDITIDGTKHTLRRFLLTTELAQISLWADDQGHLELVSAPASQYQAVRKN